MPTKLAVIGAGGMLEYHAKGFKAAGAEIVAIADMNAEAAAKAAKEWDAKESYSDVGEMLEKTSADAVSIIVPNKFHAPLAIQCLNAGKHVFCEKPLALTTAEALQISAAAKENDVRWLDATGWIHHERTQDFAKQFAAGRLGKIGHISAAVSFYQPFQSGDHRLDPSLGGGCLLDLAWYAGGAIRFAAGKLPHRVFADAVVVDRVPQRVTAMLWFDDDVTATLSCGYDTATRKWFEVAGSDASLVCDDFTRPWAEKPARCWIHAASGDVEQLSYEGSQERNMISALVGDENLQSWQNQAIDTHRILDALNQSIESGNPQTVEST